MNDPTPGGHARELTPSERGVRNRVALAAVASWLGYVILGRMFPFTVAGVLLKMVGAILMGVGLFRWAKAGSSRARRRPWPELIWGVVILVDGGLWMYGANLNMDLLNIGADAGNRTERPVMGDDFIDHAKASIAESQPPPTLIDQINGALLGVPAEQARAAIVQRAIEEHRQRFENRGTWIQASQFLGENMAPVVSAAVNAKWRSMVAESVDRINRGEYSDEDLGRVAYQHVRDEAAGKPGIGRRLVGTVSSASGNKSGRPAEDRLASTEPSAEAIFAETSPAVVRVEVSDRNTMGSGFVVSEDGLVVTNHHVIQDAHSANVIFPDGSKYRTERIVLSLRSRDLALIKIRGRKFPCLRLAEDALPAVGSKVYAIGNPLGLTNSFSDGLVSGHREVDRGDTLIQTTAAISPGSSGGPLLSSRGQVVGVTTATFRRGQNLNLAIPVRFLREAIQELEWSQTIANAEGRGAQSADAQLAAIIKKYLVEGMTQSEAADLIQSFTNRSKWDSMQTYRTGELIPDFDHVVKPWRFEPYVTRYLPFGDSRGNAPTATDAKRPRATVGDRSQIRGAERAGMRYRLNLLFIESRLRAWYSLPDDHTH